MVYSDIHLPLPGFIALDWSLMTVALIPILLRLSLRQRNRGAHSRAMNFADAFVAFAWLSGIVLISINTWKNHLRMKYEHYPPEDLYYGVPLELSGHLLYLSWISLFFIYISLWSSKAAFLAFYYSIFSLQGKRARITLAVASVFTASTFLLHMFLIAFWCSPISKNWSPPPGEHLCSAVHSISSVTVSTFANVATDLVILAIPTTTLLATQLGKTDLAGLAFVFLMGSVSILAALVRFVVLKLVEHVPRAEITHTIDVWALVEIVSSILAVCLPSLRTFARKYRQGHGYHASSSSVNSRSTRSRSLIRGLPSRASSNNNASSGSLKHLPTESLEELAAKEGAKIEEIWFRGQEGERKGIEGAQTRKVDWEVLGHIKRPEEARTPPFKLDVEIGEGFPV